MIAMTGLAQPKVGETLPLWTEGYLDMHHINTGQGESSFLMLPDGTTMLVDAGAVGGSQSTKPNGDRTPGEWISRYILHFLLNQAEKKLNVVLLTHFHGDHIGSVYPGLKTSKTGGFLLTGITEIGEKIVIDKIVDRDWPGYNWPKSSEEDNVKNYIRFVKWSVENNGVKAEQFRVGANDQFALVHNPEKYPDFKIRNLAANGHVWTGTGNNERNHFPSLESLSTSQYPGENMCSAAFRLSYGKFDYFNGGDITTTSTRGQWQDIETPVGMVTGPVDVCVANHHGFFDAMGVPFLQAVRPRVIILQTCAASHPSHSVFLRMLSGGTYPGPRDIFATNIMQETKVVIGPRIDNMKSQQGHIVVRISPGGESYMIYILDDLQESFTIRTIQGPYSCN
jgi:beta-lactamase superfamily II metal-dependent hydrolase